MTRLTLNTIALFVCGDARTVMAGVRKTQR
jgi:hypothetical protein